MHSFAHHYLKEAGQESAYASHFRFEKALKEKSGILHFATIMITQPTATVHLTEADRTISRRVCDMNSTIVQ